MGRDKPTTLTTYRSARSYAGSVAGGMPSMEPPRTSLLILDRPLDNLLTVAALSPARPAATFLKPNWTFQTITTTIENIFHNSKNSEEQTI